MPLGWRTLCSQRSNFSLRSSPLYTHSSPFGFIWMLAIWMPAIHMPTAGCERSPSRVSKRSLREHNQGSLGQPARCHGTRKGGRFISPMVWQPIRCAIAGQVDTESASGKQRQAWAASVRWVDNADGSSCDAHLAITTALFSHLWLDNDGPRRELSAPQTCCARKPCFLLRLVVALHRVATLDAEAKPRPP